MKKREPVTMADIARTVGCSTANVTHVVAADYRVPRQLRRDVLDAIECEGYQPLEAVQARLGRPLRVALVLKTYLRDNPQENRFYLPIAYAIALTCATHGAELIDATMVLDDRYSLCDVPETLMDGSCDAALLMGVQLDEDAVRRVKATGRTVILAAGYAHGNGLDSVVTDNVAGAFAAVEHLLAAGHKDIAMLGTEPMCYPSILARREGYVQAVASLGLRSHMIDSSYTLTDAAAVLGVDYIRRHPEVTALFGANDLTTVAFMQAARDAGYRVPSDISLVGFDDVDVASLVTPPLTTIAIDKAPIGRAAFALMAHRLEEPDANPVTSVVMPRLIQRDSVAPPKRRFAG